MDIHYKVELLTYWHCGSGLAAGADVDALVIKDPQGLPYIPGRTMKGLLREAAEEILSLRTGGAPAKENPLYGKFIRTFGLSTDATSRDAIHRVQQNAIHRVQQNAIRGEAFFTNAVLSDEEKRAILDEDLGPYIYRSLASTAIDPDGIVIDHSLRRIEVTVPCTLYGRISGLPDDEDLKGLMKDALRYIKRLGQNRNRGLGRCRITPVASSPSKTTEK